MIWIFLINVIVAILSVLTSIFPVVTMLPTIGGYDIDAALVEGVGMFNTYAASVWPVYDVFLGFLFMLGYYTIKMLLKVFLGHRAPGSHH